MDTQKKRWKSEVNTKTPKTKEQRQSQQPKKRGGGEGGEIRNLQQITKEKKKEREKRNIPRKKCSVNWKRKIAEAELEQLQEQAEKKGLGAMNKEIGKSKRGNERGRKIKN